MPQINYHFDSFPPHSSFKQLNDSLGLNQHILIPSHDSGNIIDIIFTPTLLEIIEKKGEKPMI